MSKEKSAISVFQKYLTVWVILCMVIGVLIGKFLPQIPDFLNRFEYAKVSIPMAILIWLMIYPMMMKVDFQSIKNVGKNPKGLFVTWITNWLIKPFTMYGIASLFFFVIFKAFITPDLATEYLAGAVLLGAAPCTAMVFVWSSLTKGDPAYTVVQVATNDLIILLGLNVEYQHLSYDGSILGMTSFTEMGVQVFEDDDNEAYFFLDGKTVLVEKDLNFDSKLKGRKNFTLMHEGSHQIFKMLFPNDYGVTQKSAGVHYYKANSEKNKPISDWEEWQANTLGAAILLPENLIKQGMYLFSLGEKIECLNKIYYQGTYKRFEALADFLGCSKKALAIRMKQLGLLKKEYLDNPFDMLTIYPEVSKS